ncbi:MAG: biopolymer transporter ExbD [Leptospiraceae bacterium]|nr:biopolymer transporter ExbD [Leptospiraceae bacterium]MDW7975807.1 biopolymer transporter ExbD [Leptospiraceae bacterium]
MSNGIQKPKEYISTINITPFTDVILVLLIIFMISIPNIYLTSYQIRLPKGTSDTTLKSYTEIIAIDQNGNIYYKNRLINKTELEGFFFQKSEQEKKQSVILINADQNTKHGQVVEIISLLKDLGYANVHIGISK